MTGEAAPFEVDARAMRCPWPALRAARAMRQHKAVLVRADDPIAPKELAALAQEQGWAFEIRADHLFYLAQRSGIAQPC